ncbi:unnamed protein product [Acidithrix sp. C25]|nr:unnamed protein product [Acidithrix sp. C25]
MFGLESGKDMNITPRRCHLVIPAFNEVASITRCLDSAVSAALPTGWSWAEFVLLDDCSDDGTVEAVEAWSSIHSGIAVRIVVSPRRRGKAENLGSWHKSLVATAPYEDVVVVVDADVGIEKESLKALLHPFATDSELAVVWGVDRPEGAVFGRWSSLFQLEAVTALARRSGDTAPRVYGRFFGYRVGGLKDFSWGSSSVITDDVQLADFVRRHQLKVFSAWDAKVLVTPAGNYRDFYLQTYRFFQDVSVSREIDPEQKLRTAVRDRWIVLATRAVRKPHWAVAYAAARLVAMLRHYFRGNRFTSQWIPTDSTKVNSANASGIVQRAALFYTKSCLTLKIVEHTRNWPNVLSSTIQRRFGWNKPDDVFILRTRRGVELRSPNTLACEPIYEIVGNDVYRLRDLDLPPSVKSVLDIGAHVGAFTCVLADYLPDASFTCVEPSVSTRHWLERNLAANGIADRVRVLGAAIASEDGETKFFEEGEASCISSTYAFPGSHPVPIRTISFATAVSQCQMAPEIVKMDCDGGEYEAIYSSPDSCWESVNHLFIEYHPVPDQHFDTIHKRLIDLGLMQVWHQPSRIIGLGIAYYTRKKEVKAGF